MNNELYHYGVVGMRWGVRRASRKLSKATTKEDRDRAIAKLNKHRTKAGNKVQKLNKQRVRLQKDVDRHVTKNDKYSITLKQKSAKLKRKALSRFTSEDRAQRLMLKAMRLDAKADTLMARSQLAKNKLEKNKTMTRLFEEGISNIDNTLHTKKKKVNKGR